MQLITIYRVSDGAECKCEVSQIEAMLNNGYVRELKPKIEIKTDSKTQK